jgi:hypothetical protein
METKVKIVLIVSIILAGLFWSLARALVLDGSATTDFPQAFFIRRKE